ncbi:MAG: hypothetical protein U0U25_04200 [Flavobacteriales bacterium]
MERRELYDPEDIEQLLMERGFDELLPEERAFVLRHLDGAAEYERMRALLLNVAQDDADTDPADADPHVRAHVLEVFREQKRPQYTIWLNSVAAFLVPERPSGYWRPALALTVVAVVTTVALLAPWAREAAAPAAMAKVREVQANDTVHMPATAAQLETADAEDKMIIPHITAPAEPGDVDDAVVPMATADEAMPPDPGASAAGAVTTATGLAAVPQAPSEDLAKAFEGTETQDMEQLERLSDAPVVHEVGKAELFSNQSLANEQQQMSATVATSRSRSKAARKRDQADGGDVLASTPAAYLTLLKAAW